jgi:hypothetical protein
MAYTFVEDDQMTLVDQRSFTVAELITKIGAGFINTHYTL